MRDPLDAPLPDDDRYDESEPPLLELVDSLTQTLFASSLVAEGLVATFKRSVAEGEQGLAELRQLIRSALGEVYSLQMELRSSALEGRPLAEMLHHIGATLSGRASVRLVTSGEAGRALPPEVHTALYRIAFDTVHALDFSAPDAQVLIELHCQPDETRLRIIGDGASLDPARSERARTALGRVAARARAIGASFEHANTPPGRTLILIHLVQPPPAAHSAQNLAA